jgi:phenylalanyl-tRNA synthetase beta chain
MVSVKFDKKYISKLIGTNFDDKNFEDEAVKMGIEVNEINSQIISVELNSNRLDLLDAVGFARAFKNFTHKSKKFKYKILNKSGIEVEVNKNVSKFRPYISAIVVKNIIFDEESLKNLLNFVDKFSDIYGRNRAKLAIGIHNLESIKGNVTYEIAKNGNFIPLNFTENISLKDMLSKTDKGIVYNNTIKNGEFYPIIKDDKGIMALIPIINSERTKISINTKKLFIDITGTSRYAVERSADLLSAMFIDMNAEVQMVDIKYYNEIVSLPKMYEEFIFIPLAKIEKQIGVKIGQNNIISLANKMGYEAASLGKNIKFRLPVYRLDIMNEQDIIEDIAIAYGYDNIPSIPVASKQQGSLEQRTITNNKISNLMIGMGFTESMNSYLTNEEDNFKKFLLNSEDVKYIKIKNSRNQNMTILRTHILPSLLKDAGLSVHEKMPQQMFEIDMVFRIEDKKPIEEYHLACISIDPKFNFNDIKKITESFLKHMNIDYELKESSTKAFVPGRAAKIISKNKEIGCFGEINPEVLNNFGIEEPSNGFEIII